MKSSDFEWNWMNLNKIEWQLSEIEWYVSEIERSWVKFIQIHDSMLKFCRFDRFIDWHIEQIKLNRPTPSARCRVGGKKYDGIYKHKRGRWGSWGAWGQHSVVDVLGMNRLYGCNCKKIMAVSCSLCPYKSGQMAHLNEHITAVHEKTKHQ